jgi:gamma-glutamyltranspeptidase/glutathione hydrolase
MRPRSRTRTRTRCLALIVAVVASCTRQPPTAVVVPFATGRAEASNGVVASANLLASQAGLEMLRRGGNAVDAAVATAFALNVVDPMMAGIGGGGGMTIWLARERRAEFVEFYPMAGTSAVEPGDAATRTPERLTLVPGAVAGLLSALERHGTLPRDVVMAPAIRLARDGFPAHTWLTRVVDVEKTKLQGDANAARLLLPGGKPLMPGDHVVQPALAATLEAIARNGRDAFYRGANAEAVVARLNSGGNPITLDDFAAYQARWYKPLCSTFAGYTILSSPPPLGGAQLLEMLHLVELRDVAKSGLPSVQPASLVTIADAIRTARADWSAFNGFPARSAVPARGLVSDAFARERLAATNTPIATALRAGDPWDEDAAAIPASCERAGAFAPTTLPRPTSAPAEPPEVGPESETTHLSVVDRDRNGVSLTFTLGLHFGSGVYVNGAWYNSANSNFGRGANARAPRSIPSSTIAPTIVLQGDALRMVVGSPSSAYIQPAILETMVNTLIFNVEPWTSVVMPRLNVTGNAAHVEGGFAAQSLAALRQRGYDIVTHKTTDDLFGAVQMILVERNGRLIGAADPRREGAAIGW